MKWKRRIGLLPLPDPPLSHRWASSYARHLGEMSARSRAGSLSSDEGGGLYEAAYRLVRGLELPLLFNALCIVREKGMTWDDMGINGKVWAEARDIVLAWLSKQDVEARNGVNYLSLGINGA